MKKVLLFIFGLMIIATPALFSRVKAADNKIELIFAEDCRDRESCTEFAEENNLLIRQKEVNKGDEIAIDIVIKNPNNLPINSITSWIKYDPTVYKALSIKSDDSPFTLASPDGDKINAKEGLIQIARAAIGSAIIDDEIIVASVILEILTDQKISSNLEFFNFQKTELGQTGIFSTTGLFTENILQEEPKKLRIFLNGATTYVPEGATTIPEDIIPDIGGPEDIENIENPITSKTIARPTGLKIKAENGQVKLIWEKGSDNRIAGYYVFYSTKSGRYLFRRDVSFSNNAIIDNLENGKTYYFAIAAYDSQINETDFSNEVYATVGKKGSESHSFSNENLISGNELVSPNGETEKVGPENILFIALGMTMTILLLFKLSSFRNFSLSK